MLTAYRSTTFRALGTTATLAIDDPGAFAPAEEMLRHELAAIDRSCSRFRDDSELSGVNRAAGTAVHVSSLLIEALDVALRAATITGGDVDPTVGRAMGEAGYDRDFSLVSGPSPGVRVRLAPVPGWRSVQVDRAAGTVTVRKGVRIDLGATAKAFAADRAASAIHESTGAGVLIGLGGDLALAGDAPGDGWPVYVTEDHRRLDAEGAGETVCLRDGGLATSSTTVRRWGPDGDPRHHIIDPASGAPVVEVWRTVSVAAATCIDANIASTAAIVRGRDALGWLAGMGLPSRLVTRDGEVEYVGDWPRGLR